MKRRMVNFGKYILFGMVIFALLDGVNYACFATKTTITYWDKHAESPEREAWEAMVKKFNKEHPDIFVKATFYGNKPYETKIRVGYRGGNPPDVAGMYNGEDLFEFARSGLIEDLTSWVEKNKERFVSGAFDTLKWNEKYWAIPLEAVLGNLIWYNVDLLKNFGIDANKLDTWSDFLTACEKLKQAGVMPIAFGNSELWNGEHWVGHFLTRTLGPEKLAQLYGGEISWNNPAVIKAFELYQELGKKGYFTKQAVSLSYAHAYSLFLQGKAGFFQTGGWFAQFLTGETKPDFNVDYILFPKIEGFPSEQNDIVMLVTGYIISAETKHLEESIEFCSSVASPEYAAILVNMLGRLTLCKGIDPYISKQRMQDPIWRHFAADASTARSTSVFIGQGVPHDVLANVLRPGTQGLLTGDLTPTEFARQMENAYEKAGR